MPESGAISKAEQRRKWKQMWYQKRKAAGLCTSCSNPLDTEKSGVYCSSCLTTRSERLKNYYHSRKSLGVCTRCRASLEGGTETLCKVCKAQAATYHVTKKLRRVEAGRCRTCGLPKKMGEGGKDCINCSSGAFRFRWQ